MSYTNPHFANEQRSPYELCNLLRSLPASLDMPTNSVTNDEQQQLYAADEHAANYTGTLLSGLESMGRLLYAAAHNERCPLQPVDAQQIGSLIAELAIQLQFLDDFRGMVAGRTLHMALKDKKK